MMNSHPQLMGLTALIVILSLGVSGCETTSPIAHIPSVIIYQAENETRVYVTGEEHLFEGINITINGTSKVENFTYGMMSNTTLTSFQLEVRVYDEEGDENDPKHQWYTYTATVSVEVEDDKTLYRLIDIHDDKEVSKEAPYKTLMEKVK